jgi:hypothetical protein
MSISVFKGLAVSIFRVKIQAAVSSKKAIPAYELTYHNISEDCNLKLMTVRTSNLKVREVHQILVSVQHNPTVDMKLVMVSVVQFPTSDEVF